MLTALALSCVLAMAPGEDARVDAEVLFDSGQAKYATHDYVGAIADFTAAYSLARGIEDAQLREQVLSRLAFNLARAHVFAYDVDGSLEHLELARRLLLDYRGHERTMGRDPDADTDVSQLEQDLLQRERAREESQEHQPDAVERSRRSRTQLRAGISLLALAPAFAGVAVGGAVLGTNARSDFELGTTGDARLDARRRGRLGDALLGVGAGLAGASAIAGVTLIVVSRRGKPTKLAFNVQPSSFVIGGRF